MRENMNDNFKLLNTRVLDSLDRSDLVRIRNMLSNIKDSTLVSGVGGSSVVSNYLAKVLENKNNIIASPITSRDVLYRNIDNYKNIICCSYSGNNLGVDICLDNSLNKYLFSTRERSEFNNINYVCDKENSFISLSSTLIPLSILLSYYLDGDINIIKDILDIQYNFNIKDSLIYEVLSGYESSSASKFIESTLVESGIGIPVIHDKYDYCHGRSTLGYVNDSCMIYFNNCKELDNLLLTEINEYYKDVIVLDKKYNDDIINDYYFTYLSMLLSKEIALLKEKDLSIVDHSPTVKKLYKYNEGM